MPEDPHHGGALERSSSRGETDEQWLYARWVMHHHLWAVDVWRGEGWKKCSGLAGWHWVSFRGCRSWMQFPARGSRLHPSISLKVKSFPGDDALKIQANHDVPCTYEHQQKKLDSVKALLALYISGAWYDNVDLRDDCARIP